jgi:hypothetical protein
VLLGLALLLVPVACQEQADVVPRRRFEVHAVQTSAGPMLVRFDSATGALTQSPLADGREWQPLGSTPALAGGSSRPGRFSLDYVQAPSIPLTFIRADTETGAVWRMGHPRDRDWIALRTSPPTAAAAEAPVPPAAARERRPPPSPELPAEAPGGTPDAPPPQEEVATLVQAAESPDLPGEMRSWAAEQLGAVPGEQAVASLIGLLADDDPTVVRTAIRALARQDDPRVRPAIEKLRQHASPEVRRVAETTLRGLR